MKESRTIVLTGVSRGLGRALLTEFDAAGHTVVGCARSARHIDELQTRFPDRHRFDVLDLNVSDTGTDNSIKTWADSVIKQYGAPDLLINNAAGINTNAPLWEVPYDEIALVMNINITSVASMIRYFVPAMIAAGEGVVINLSSGWGRSVSAEVAPYCASKFAIEGMTKALATELPSGLAAIPLNPGVINTDMLQSCFGESAGNYTNAEAWARTAAPYILGLKVEHNGQSLSVPG